MNWVKVEGKVHPRTRHEDPDGEWRYSCNLSQNSALYGMGGQRHAPAALTPGKDTRYPLWAPGSVWTGEENVAATGIRSAYRLTRGESLY